MTPPLTAWLHQGARSAALLSPAMPARRAGAGVLLALLACEVALGLLFERLYIAGPARFHGPGLLGGWLATLVAAYACFTLAPRRASALLALLLAQGAALTLLWGSVFTLLIHGGALPQLLAWPAARWAAWVVPLAWTVAAALLLVWRGADAGARRSPALACLPALAAALVLQHWLQPAQHWVDESEPPASAEAAGPDPVALTQTLWEAQPRLLHDALQALPAERPGRIDVYAITFAPYADEDVFQRESAMVAGVMAERFGAAGRTLQLVNHRSTLEQQPWATPTNLRRAIRRAAERMNPAEDLLFIHLTSHGARDGRLAATLPPLALDELTPQQLAGWLVEYGVRHAVVSISACHSGSWLPLLAAPGRLVMTAADAEHTSYGCGRGSPLTFFGRAMFDEQLRRTRDWPTAHAAARAVIADREKAAGKDDGFSNPQISVGSAIEPLLQALAAQQAR